MSACNRNNCVGLAVIISIIVGAVAAVLTFAAVITVAPAFLWVAFGIGIAALATFVWIAAFTDYNETRNCLARVFPAVITGIFGTIATAIVLLAIAFAATSVIGAIITGLLAAFLTLILTTAACFINCVIEE